MAQQIRYYKQDGTEYSFSKEPKIKIMQTSNADMNIGVPKNCHLSSNNSDTKKITMTQQTAVEWLYNQIPLEWTIKGSAKKIFEQAKQMEKEQIIGAYMKGGVNDFNKDEQAEQYYNETYGK